jgi:eukaryotic-like serine/threonine-protein kinase
VEALTALVARLLGWLHGVTVDAICPGGWPWAVSLLGVGVGLLPAAAAAAVALWRRRIGSHYGRARSVVLAGTGVLAAGVAPLLVFVATGRVFAAAADGGPVAGLTSRELRSVNTAVCLVGRQGRYLGEGSVTDAFAADGPVRLGLALVALVGLPVLAVLCTAASGRLAARRGPRWPARMFWVPLAAVAVLTGNVPAGSAGQLWVGAVAGAFLGIPLVLAVGPPDRVVVARAAGRLATMRRSTAGTGAARPGSPTGRPSGQWPGGSGAVPTGGASTGRAPGAGAAGPGGRWQGRLAARFAARVPEPVVSVVPAASTGAVAAATAGAVAGPVRTPSPTLVAPTGTVPPSAASAPPAAPARFRLVRRLGSGGFGGVWLAYDAGRGETVALKAAHVRDTDTEERIRREARALAAVHHPHCVRIHALVRADDDPGLAELDGLVIVMEYVQGVSLGERVRERGVVDDVAAARIWSSIAGALEAAHGCGVLHRDVKPANIVVDAAGQAHLIDFGIARQTGDATLTAAGFVLGTPDFLAPEVAAGGPATPESDVWQLAAAVGYALSGHPPRGEHADAVSGLRAAALGRPPTHLPQRSAHLPLLRAALDADPARRPSLRVVHRSLEEWLHRSGMRNGSVAAGPPAR